VLQLAVHLAEATADADLFLNVDLSHPYSLYAVNGCRMPYHIKYNTLCQIPYFKQTRLEDRDYNSQYCNIKSGSTPRQKPAG
jgi:hypothetical protein